MVHSPPGSGHASPLAVRKRLALAPPNDSRLRRVGLAARLGAGVGGCDSLLFSIPPQTMLVEARGDAEPAEPAGWHA